MAAKAFSKTLLMLVGFGCLTAAQTLLLDSREPVRPLLLFLMGIGLLLPTLAINTAQPQPTRSLLAEAVPLASRRWLERAVALILLALTLLLVQSASVPFVQVSAWLIGIIAAVWAATGGFAVKLTYRIAFTKSVAAEIMAAAGLMLVALWLQLRTPMPTIALPEHTAQLRAAQSDTLHVIYPEGGRLYLQLVAAAASDLSGLRGLSAVFAVLTIPAVYLFGRVLDRRLTGLVAAGCATTGLWTLALGKSGTVYSPLMLCSAAYLAALWWAHLSQRRLAYLAVGIALAVGWLMSPLFLVMTLLLPIQALLGYIELSNVPKKRQRTLAFRQQFRILAIQLSPLFISLLVTAAIALPMLANDPNALPSRTLPDDYQMQTGLSPTMVTTDALSSALLLFNLTSDPSPLHGIINRPVFAPITAAAFVIGLLAWAFRVYTARRWSDLLLFAALVVALLPTALAIDLPLRYPDLQRAALALPVGVVCAALGISHIACEIQAAWGSRGMAVASGVFLVGLVLLAADARRHYSEVFLPVYGHSALMERQLYGGK